MRLFIAARARSHVPADGVHAVLRTTVSSAVAALDETQPWPDENTVADLRWAPAGGRTAVLFRSNEPESVPERSGWIGNKARVWTWSGIMGTDLHTTLRTATVENSTAAEEIWNGVGSYGLVGATPQSMALFTNAHRSEALYWIDLPDAVVFSNSAAALSLLKHGGTHSYSPTGLAGLLMHGLPFIDQCAFEGVRTVPAGAAVVSDVTNDCRIVYDEPARLEGGDVDAVADKIADGLVDYAHVLTDNAKIVTAAITGGKDSRMVLAALSAAGADFTCFTTGLPESGEAHIGRQIAGLLGIEHKLVVPPIQQGRSGRPVVVGVPEQQAWMTLKSTGGMGNAFTAMPNPAQKHINPLEKVNMGGQGGEILRGGFVRRLNDEVPTARSAADVIEKTWMNNKDVLKPFAAEAVRREFRGVVDAAWSDPARSLFEGYATHRTGRWLATMRHGESVVNPHSTLLIDNRMVRLLKSLPSDALLGEKMEHAVMQRLAPPLVDVPFFRDRWAFEADGPNSHFKPDSWDARAPYTAHDQPRASFNWRVGRTPELSRYFIDYITADPNSMLFDIVDKQRALDMLNGRAYRAPLAWALFSVQFALNNAWTGDAPADPLRIEIEVPA